uniref:Uncharacterized protein n=1 Tax=Hyaloperonospora arabidopsidis (strain Emoy2) TaxID=559515 RepID=M4BHC8_HYAAE
MGETKMIHTDLTITQRMIKEGHALVSVANKSDLSGAGGNFEMQRIQNELQESLAQVRSFCGAHLRAPGSRIKKPMLEVLTVYERWELCVELASIMDAAGSRRTHNITTS